MLSYIFIGTILCWLFVGLFWLLPKKLVLLRRVGNVTNNELIRIAKAGDSEAMRLRTLGKWYVAIGLALLIPQVVLLQVLKLHH